MELKYRGATYMASSHPDYSEVTEVDEHLGLNRSVPYSTRQVKTSLRRPTEALIYRGVRYNR